MLRLVALALLFVAVPAAAKKPPVAAPTGAPAPPAPDFGKMEAEPGVPVVDPNAPPPPPPKKPKPPRTPPPPPDPR